MGRNGEDQTGELDIDDIWSVSVMGSMYWISEDTYFRLRSKLYTKDSSIIEFESLEGQELIVPIKEIKGLEHSTFATRTKARCNSRVWESEENAFARRWNKENPSYETE